MAGPVSLEVKARPSQTLEKPDEVHKTAWGCWEGIEQQAWGERWGVGALQGLLPGALAIHSWAGAQNPGCRSGQEVTEAEAAEVGQFGELERKSGICEAGTPGRGVQTRVWPLPPQVLPSPRAKEQGVRG